MFGGSNTYSQRIWMSRASFSLATNIINRKFKAVFTSDLTPLSLSQEISLALFNALKKNTGYTRDSPLINLKNRQFFWHGSIFWFCSGWGVCDLPILAISDAKFSRRLRCEVAHPRRQQGVGRYAVGPWDASTRGAQSG